ncbi:hypothetical protein KP509_29G071800 [Ceratopteris richardii]|uniref:GDSL esterase/lipase n=1 Tax=Ceratopteris richardii TaxID=49495 RepID=A0A8T2R9P7_CERRI|nr:hypothetical protein KP509_29G071800 [Ceratopteris richardii]
MRIHQIYIQIWTAAFVGCMVLDAAASSGEFARNGAIRENGKLGDHDAADISFLLRQPWNQQSNHRMSYYPAIFIFGDSLSDVGNNNNLVTLAKATRLPYGRDFPGGKPTGRFSNGLIGPDFLAEYIGLPTPPPFLSAGNNILQGVCFASGSAGILNSSGNIYGEHIPLTKQVTYFANVRQELQARLGEEGTKDLLGKSLFYFNFGSNDYVTNYFLTNGRVPSLLQAQYTPSQFQDLLLSNFALRIEELYAMGARKMAIFGLSALGCLPFQRLIRNGSPTTCVESINEIVRSYNVALLNHVHALQAAHPDAVFTYLDSYRLIDSIIRQPSAYGLENVYAGCCGSGRFNGLPTCSVPRSYNVCEDASKYLFWDFVHPTSKIYKLATAKFWTGSYPDAIPYNLRELALAS